MAKGKNAQKQAKTLPSASKSAGKPAAASSAKGGHGPCGINSKGRLILPHNESTKRPVPPKKMTRVYKGGRGPGLMMEAGQLPETSP